ncbi:PH domain-containing protein [Glutamicibacter sp. 363]|uniref:PH domain-containing protein n=1 Tax=unclassified Glutamicibacter TaxID=2627139 RepID=UPI00403343E5
MNEWQRVHPASPFVHGWLAIVGLAWVYWQNTDDISWEERFTGSRLTWTVGLGSAALVLVLIFYALSWYFTRYRISETHVYVNSGMVFRSQKQARIDRVQGIDIAQPLVARLLGLAELRFDVADGSASVMRLSFLRKAHAHQLRAEILALAQGEIPEAEEAAQPVPLMAKVPAGRLLASLFLRLPTVIGVLLALVLGILSISGVGVLVAGLVPMLLGFGGWFYKELNNSWNFSASATDTGLRISHGLADTKQQSLPAGRVQSIQISSPAFWRLLGWYRVEVNALGVGEEEMSNLLVLPVGDFEAVTQVMGILLPELGVENQRAVLHTAITSGTDHGFTSSPARAKALSPGAWKHQAFLSTSSCVITRFGWLSRSAAFVPHRRIQGMVLQQGPWERRRELAGIRLYSAGGSIMGYMHQLDEQVATEFFAAQARRQVER